MTGHLGSKPPTDSKLFASAEKVARHLFPSLDAKIYVYGHDRGWLSFEEVVALIMAILRGDYD